MTNINKNFVLFSIAILAISGLIIFGVINKNNRIKNNNTISPQASVYCSEEFLEKVKSSTPSSEEQTKKYFDCKPILAFLKENVSDSEAETLADNFKTLDGVYKVKYVSKTEALKIYKERNKNEPLLLENVKEGFLPASIEVYVSEPSLKIKVLEFANSNVLVDKVVK